MLFDLRGLIAISVFFLGLCHVSTSLSALRLVQRQKSRRLILPALRPALVLSAFAGGYLSPQVPPALIGVGALALLSGLGAYLLTRRGMRDVSTLAARLEEDEERLERWAARRERWLLDLVTRGARR